MVAGKKKLVRVAVWLFAIGGIALVAKSVSWGRVAAAVLHADGKLLAGAAALAVLSLCLQALRWHQVVQPVKAVPLRTILSASFAGQAASCVLPLRAGEAVRLELLSRATGMGRAAALGTVATDHTVNGLVMFALAALSPLVLPVPPGARLAIWGGAAAIGALLFVLLRVSSISSVTEIPRGRLSKALHKLRAGLSALQNPRAIARAAFASASAWICEIAAATLALSAFGVHQGLLAGAAVIFGVNIALAAPAPPGNLGTFELGAAMALVAVGADSQTATVFALGYHALLLVAMLVLGGAGLLALRRTEAREKRAAADAALLSAA